MRQGTLFPDLAPQTTAGPPIGRRKARPPCQHCRKYLAHRPRGLCWSCYNKPDVRNLYPTDPVFGRRGHNHQKKHTHLTVDQPTSAPPGSAEKIAVLTERASRGMNLWHPLDRHCRRTRLPDIADGMTKEDDDD